MRACVFTPRGLDSPPQLHQRFVRESWSLTSKDVRALRPVSQESLGTCLASFVHFVIAAYTHPNPPLAQKWLVSVEFWMLSGLKNFGFFKWPIFDYSSLHGLKKWSITEHSKVAVKEKIFEFRLLTVPFKKNPLPITRCSEKIVHHRFLNTNHRRVCGWFDRLKHTNQSKNRAQTLSQDKADCAV